jgi:S-adenosylmethionine hydrolase
VFLTDFGTLDDSVAICKGVMWKIAPELRIVDLTHDSPVYDIRAAARMIQGTAPYYAPGTVFLVVVDPGVGTERKPVAIKTKAGRYYVGPDNGVFWPVVQDEGLEEARVIENKAYMLPSVSGTFHGRDLFSPSAAHLVSGAKLDTFGSKLGSLVELQLPSASLSDGEIRGEVNFIERPYGNVITDIPVELVDKAGLSFGDELEVEIGGQGFKLPYRKTFGDVPVGTVVAVISSRGKLCLSINQGDFSKAYRVPAGRSVRVRKSL